MNLLHIVHQYLPEHVGGTELYTDWLSGALSRRGHRVAIFHRHSASAAGLESRWDGAVQIWRAWAGLMTPAGRFRATFSAPALAQAFERVLTEVRPDLIHIQHLMGQPAGLVDLIRQQQIPYVVTLWDFWWVCANAQLLTNYSQQICHGPAWYLNCAHCALARLERPQYRFVLPVVAGPLAGLLAGRNRLLRRVIQGAAQLIVPAEFVRQWYIEHGMPAEKLVVLPPGLEHIEPGSRSSRPPDEPLRFAYIGGLARQKGVHVLLQAFHDLDPKTELWLAGDQTTDPDYVAQLRQFSRPGVRFLGRLSRSQVWQILAQVDILVMPSLWYETFGFVISEAFAAGVPVIASRLGPLADRVRHEVDGLLVPPGDVAALRLALQRFIDDDGLLARLQSGIRPVQTIEAHAAAIEAVYQAVAGRRVES